MSANTEEPIPDVPAQSAPGLRRIALHTVVAVASTLLALASLFRVEVRAPDWDPQYARNIVERTIRFGGSYYENGIHNKGPLEPAVYSFAARLTSYDGFWFAIATFIMLASIVVGLSVRRVVASLGGPAWLGLGAVGATYVHLTLSGADYAGVLYSRNMTVVLLCFAFLAIDPRRDDRSPQMRVGALVAAGASIGLAVQTLQTAALTGLVLVALALFGRLNGSPRTVRERVWFIGAAGSVFLSAPLYYATVGPWRDFWDGWWVYGRYMTSATDRSLFDQLGLGWHEFYLYANSHAPATIAVGLFVLLGIARWPHLDRRMRALQVALPAWWIAAWFEIILTQRYSSHYFVVTTVPTAMMIAGAASHVIDLTRRGGGRVPGPRSLAGFVLAAAIVTGSITWSGTGPLVDGIERASEFDGVAPLARSRAQGRDGNARAVQALLDAVSRPADPMLAWTNLPWPYLDFHRVSATRFIWKSFLMGEVYLGRTSADFVIPGSWDRWRRDVDETQPVAFVLDEVFAVPAGTPVADLLANEFQTALVTPTLTLALRRDIVQRLIDPADDRPWRSAVTIDQGWTAAAGTVTFDGDGGDPDALRLQLGDLRCRTWSAQIDEGGVALHFDDPTGGTESLEMFIDGDQAVSRSPNVVFLDTAVEVSGGARVTLVVGTSSAILMVGEVVVGAISLASVQQVTLSSVGAATTLSSVTEGDAPLLGACTSG